MNGNKLGTLQFCGTTEFAGGIWAGIALDEPEGKNDGSVKGVPYFKCLPEHGVFVPPNKISKVINSFVNSDVFILAFYCDYLQQIVICSAYI